MLNRLSLALGALFLFAGTALAQSPAPLARQAQSFPAPPILARAGIAVDADSRAVLASRNPRMRLPMASTTKIMTALLALKLGRLTDRITVPTSAFNFEWDATVMGLHAGQVVTLEQLLYGLMLPSGADAANVIAIHYGGSEAGFVAMMNREAALLGMHDTHYVNAHGLTAPGHYTSAYDLATLAEYAVGFPDLMKITSARTYNWNGHILTNVNRVLFWYPGVDGIKPGFTDDAGMCQVIDVHRDGRHAIVILLNTPNLDTDARNLLNYSLGDFRWVQSQLPADNPMTTESGTDAGGGWVYFPASGHFVRGPFLTAYRAAGGASALGFPRTDQLSSGKSIVQYFQNGELARGSTGTITRVPLGSTPMPAPTVLPTATATSTVTPTELPLEATVGPVSRITSTPLPVRKSTPIPYPLPTARVTPTPTPTHGASTAAAFLPFQRAHWKLLGAATTPLQSVRGYGVQVFAYGALTYRQGSKDIFLLPIGDRALTSLGYLASHSGNTYPLGFAPPAILQSIGWLPSYHG